MHGIIRKHHNYSYNITFKRTRIKYIYIIKYIIASFKISRTRIPKLKEISKHAK